MTVIVKDNGFGIKNIIINEPKNAAAIKKLAAVRNTIPYTLGREFIISPSISTKTVLKKTAIIVA